MSIDPATLPECHEGPEAFRRFDDAVRQALSVPHSLIERRERAYRKQVDANQKRRGPKRKAVTPPSASPAPGV